MPPPPTFEKTKTSDSNPDQHSQVSNGDTSEFNDQRGENVAQLELQQIADNSASVSEIYQLEEKANPSGEGAKATLKEKWNSDVQANKKAKNDEEEKEKEERLKEIKNLITAARSKVGPIKKAVKEISKKLEVLKKIQAAKEKAEAEALDKKEAEKAAKEMAEATSKAAEISKEIEVVRNDLGKVDENKVDENNNKELHKYLEDNEGIKEGIKKDLETIELKDERVLVDKAESFVSKVEEVTDVHMGSTGEYGAGTISSLNKDSFHKESMVEDRVFTRAGVGKEDKNYGNAANAVGMVTKGVSGIFVFAGSFHKFFKNDSDNWDKVDAVAGMAQGVATTIEGVGMFSEQMHRTNAQNLKTADKGNAPSKDDPKIGKSGEVGYTAGAVADILSAGRNAIGIIHNVGELWKSSEKLTGAEKQKLRVEVGIKTAEASKSIASATGKIDALANQGTAVLTGVPMAAGIIAVCKELIVVFDMFLRWQEWKNVYKEIKVEVVNAAKAFNKEFGFKLTWEHEVAEIAEGKRKFAALKANKKAYLSKEEEKKFQKLLKELNKKEFKSVDKFLKAYAEGEEKIKAEQEKKAKKLEDGVKPPDLLTDDQNAALDEYILWRELLIQKDKAADRDLLKFYTTVVKLSGSIAKIIPDATALAVGVGMTTGAALIDAGAAGMRETKQAARDSKAKDGYLGKLAPTADTSKTTAAKKAWRIEQSQKVCNKVIELNEMKSKFLVNGSFTDEGKAAGKKVELMLKATGIDYEKTEPKDLALKVYTGFLKREM